MRIITQQDFGKSIEVKLHELFGVEVAALHPSNEYLAVPSFSEKENYRIIKEYNYIPNGKSGIQAQGKRIYLLMATKIGEIDLSWYNLTTAEEELHFMLAVTNSDASIVSSKGQPTSDNSLENIPNAVSRSEIVF